MGSSTIINWHLIDLKNFEHLIYLINLIETHATAWRKNQ